MSMVHKKTKVRLPLYQKESQTTRKIKKFKDILKRKWLRQQSKMQIFGKKVEMNQKKKIQIVKQARKLTGKKAIN